MPPTQATPARPAAPARTRPDRCPGVLRPWPAADGALVRVRLVGGRTTAHGLAALGALAEEHGDGDLHLTGRANLQLRALPDPVPEALVARVEAAGALPSRLHDLARNVVVSAFTGLAGGRADLRPVAAELDRLICADPALAALPGRFLHVLDDGRGDVVDRPLDLGLVALDATTAQLRVGSAGWGDVVPLAEAPARLVALARAFLAARGTGPDAAWNVDELAEPLHEERDREPRTFVHAPPPPPGPQPGGTHVAVPDGVLTPARRCALLAGLAPEHPLVVTPWHGVVVP